jgi:hypothetical protein
MSHWTVSGHPRIEMRVKLIQAVISDDRSPPNSVAESSRIRADLVSTSSGIRRHFVQAFSHEGNMTPKIPLRGHSPL